MQCWNILDKCQNFVLFDKNFLKTLLIPSRRLVYSLQTHTLLCFSSELHCRYIDHIHTIQVVINEQLKRNRIHKNILCIFFLHYTFFYPFLDMRTKAAYTAPLN